MISVVPFKKSPPLKLGTRFRQEMNGCARGREKLRVLITANANLVICAFVPRSETAGASHRAFATLDIEPCGVTAGSAASRDPNGVLPSHVALGDRRCGP